MKNYPIYRVASIDIYRALTMLLMIWVNDFWTLQNIPKWLLHAKTGEDYLGFSDLIFPWFLFIVGLSIPFAIENRLKKGESTISLLWHIAWRSLALLVMGIFLVNAEYYHAEATGISKPWFVILLMTAFFLVWNSYPENHPRRNILNRALQATGIVLLIFLAIVYRGNTDSGDGVVIMQTRWWGILGLIGWTYLVAAPLYLFLRNHIFLLSIFLIVFLLLNLAGSMGFEYRIFSWQSSQWWVGNGAFHAFAMGGIITSVYLKKRGTEESTQKVYLLGAILTIIWFITGWISDQFLVTSKNLATFPWVLYSLASALPLFLALHWLVDKKGKKDLFKVIKPAGVATLTCYLVPYWVYSLMTLLDLEAPSFLSEGLIGLLKSMAFALLIVGLTKFLLKAGIRLKV